MGDLKNKEAVEIYEAHSSIRAGGRYTRFVGCMRLGLPLVAGAIIITIIIWPQLPENKKQFRLGISASEVAGEISQAIVNPRYTGLNTKQRPYTITAETASPTAKDPDLIKLTSPKADLVTREGRWLALSAPSGLFDKGKEELTLQDTVNFFHDSGHELIASNITIDLKGGSALSRENVKGQGPLGNIHSKGIRITDNGSRWEFLGPAKITFYPSSRQKQP